MYLKDFQNVKKVVYMHFVAFLRVGQNLSGGGGGVKLGLPPPSLIGLGQGTCLKSDCLLVGSLQSLIIHHNLAEST